MIEIHSEAISPQEVIVRVTGDIDMNTSPKLRDHFKESVSQNLTCITVDLSGVAFMDSSGIATLVEVLQILHKRKGRLSLKSMQPQVRSVFEIAHLLEVFEVQD